MKNILEYFKRIYCSATVLTVLLFFAASFTLERNKLLLVKIITATPLTAAILGYYFSKNLQNRNLRRAFFTEAVLMAVVSVFLFLQLRARLK